MCVHTCIHTKSLDTRNRAKAALEEECQNNDSKAMLMAAVGLMRLLAMGSQEREGERAGCENAWRGRMDALNSLVVEAGVLSRDLMSALTEDEDSSSDSIRLKVDAVLNNFNELSGYCASTQDCCEETRVCCAHASFASFSSAKTLHFHGKQDNECVLRLIKVCACEYDHPALSQNSEL